MHRALFLEEILHAILHRCHHGGSIASLAAQGYRGSDLVALACTCSVFKEPALDVLWSELKDLTPLVRCLPELCVTEKSELGYLTYSLCRQLTEAELGTVRKYTRRVRVMFFLLHHSLDMKNFRDICSPSSPHPLFPNIRKLHFGVTRQTLSLLHHFASQQLRWLYLHMEALDGSSCRRLIQSLSTNCVNLKTIVITSPPTLDETMIQLIHYWKSLQEIDCSTICLDIDALLHLSSLPGLTALSFVLNHELTDQIASSNHLLEFFVLRSLRVNVTQLTPISDLFTHMRLPAIASISAVFNVSPPGHIFRPFLVALQEACTSQSHLHLSIQAIAPLNTKSQEDTTLTLQDICLATALNLASLAIDLDRIVDLKDSALLEIAASVGQRLGSLIINPSRGWKTAGVTPAGLMRFLQQCPSLKQVCVALDVRGYTSLSQIPTSGGHPLPAVRVVNLVDSGIEADTVPALAIFFADAFLRLSSGRSSFILKSWGSPTIRRRHRNWRVYMERWHNVAVMAKIFGPSDRRGGGDLLSWLREENA